MSSSKGRMFSSVQRKALAIALSIVMLFTTGYAIGVLSAINVNMPMKEQPVVATTEITTTETTTAPTTTEPTTEPTTLPPETTTTAAPATTAPAEEDECCLSGLFDMITGFIESILSTLC
ncbi:MAG: hypothetical protein IKJ70_06115 [Clostridia bacterium]|nr:hypothetical protein [Clostridia bacterium]